MPSVFIVTGHTPLSPGGVNGDRTEYQETKSLCEALKGCISTLSPEIDVITGEGNAFIEKAGRDDFLLVLHKGTYDKNAPTGGAEIYVKKEADAACQYQAYRLLCSLCGKDGYRYRGVHPLTAVSPFRAFGGCVPDSAFLLKAGYIESEADCLVWDKRADALAEGLAGEIIKIYKEKNYEVNSAVYTASLGGEHFKAS